MRTLLMLGISLVVACSNPPGSARCTIPENRPEGHSDDLIDVQQAIGFECITDEDCIVDDTSRWMFPDQVRCEANACIECSAASECGDAGMCRYGECFVPPTCASEADCVLGPEGGPRQACIQGYCQDCASDDDCEDGEICWQSRYQQPPMCVAEDKIDPACVDHTCGVWCQGWDSELQLIACHTNVPESDDYEQSCNKDSDCVKFEEKHWDRATCECRCRNAVVSECAAEAFAEDRADTRTLYGCEEAPDCACDPATATCENGRCTVL